MRQPAPRSAYLPRRRPGARTAGGVAALALWFACGCTSGPEVGVGAAMSLYDVLPEILSDAGVAAEVTFAGSSTLVRQVQAGAPLDVLVTADEASLAPLGARYQIVCIAATNRLVRIAPRGGGSAGPLALAAPHVPAGRYARSVLPEEVTREALVFDHVRGVLAAVARGDAAAGVVYATDAAREPRVRVTGVLLSEGIVYPVAVRRDAPEAARALARRFCGPEARRRLLAAGFGGPP